MIKVNPKTHKFVAKENQRIEVAEGNARETNGDNYLKRFVFLFLQSFPCFKMSYIFSL